MLLRKKGIKKSAPDTTERLKSSASRTIKLNPDNFDRILSKNENLVVDCWNPRCLPCKRIHPMIDELSEKYSGKIAFGKLNTDDSVEVAMRCGVMSVPTVLVFKEGRKVGAIKEVRSIEHLESYILKKLEVKR